MSPRRILVLYGLCFFGTLFVAGAYFESVDSRLLAILTLGIPALVVWFFQSIANRSKHARNRREKAVASDSTGREPSAVYSTPPHTPIPSREAVKQPKPPTAERNEPTKVEVTNVPFIGAYGPPIVPIQIVEDVVHVKPLHKPIQTIEAPKPGSGAFLPPDYQGWVPHGKKILIGGRVIGGMVYVGRPPFVQGAYSVRPCSPYIDPSLSLAMHQRDKEGTYMSYWPCYSEIRPQCRTTYLDWLGSGARDSSYNAGYAFLYFYGLERRFFIDQPDQEESYYILEEVERLMALYPDNGSVQRYMSAFRDIAYLQLSGDLAPPVGTISHGKRIPLGVRLKIGALLRESASVDADAMLEWFLNHPISKLRITARRCPEEFRAMFRVRFDGSFPNGLKVDARSPDFQLVYQAASTEFKKAVTMLVGGRPVPDITDLFEPIQTAQDIADIAALELAEYSRVLTRHAGNRNAVEVQAFLPRELRAQLPTPELDGVREWAREIIHGSGLVPIKEVLAQFNSDASANLTKRQFIELADILARCGLGIAPDPRYSFRAPRIDEPVVLFDLGFDNESAEVASELYQSHLLQLALGSIVVTADGQVTEQERALLDGYVAKAGDLTDSELRRLRANMEWFLAVPPDLPTMRRKLSRCDAEQQETVRIALVAAAHADGSITPEEVVLMEKLYKSLGLDTDRAYADLHAYVAGGIRAPARFSDESTERVSTTTDSAARPMLDPDRIARIRRDTERASSVLAGIFTEFADAGMDSSDPSTNEITEIKGIDGPHGRLILELMAKMFWTTDEFAALTGKLGLLPAGAVETINEWAFDVYDEAFLEEDDGYRISPDVSQTLADELEKERRSVKTKAA